jgi:UDP-3-O-[3-hydroxymyristoyl] glucosamine N-acyltransferase
MIAGAVGFVGHLQIADDVVITGRRWSIARSTSPACTRARFRWMRRCAGAENSARFRHLDELARRVQALEATLGKKGERDRDD